MVSEFWLVPTCTRSLCIQISQQRVINFLYFFEPAMADLNGDGEIDQHEWMSSFETAYHGGGRESVRAFRASLAPCPARPLLCAQRTAY